MQQSQAQQLPVVTEPVPVEETPADGTVGKDGSPADWMVDPNEPRYCLCNEVSYGEMVGCDNDDVSFNVTVQFEKAIKIFVIRTH